MFCLLSALMFCLLRILSRAFSHTHTHSLYARLLSSRIMTCENDGVVKYWDEDAKEALVEIKAHTEANRARVDSTQGTHFAIGGNVSAAESKGNHESARLLLAVSLVPPLNVRGCYLGSDLVFGLVSSPCSDVRSFVRSFILLELRPSHLGH